MKKIKISSIGILLICIFQCLVVSFAEENILEIEITIGVHDENFMVNPVVEYILLSKYPYIKIRYIRIDDDIEYYLDCNENAIDILIINEDERRCLIRDGYLYNLYQLLSSENIWNEHMIDIRNFCETDENLYVYPRSLHQAMWLWSLDIANSHDIEIPSLSWDWTDFICFAQAIRSDKHLYLYAGKEHVSGILSNYLLDPLTDYLQLYCADEINPSSILQVYNTIATIYTSNILCSLSELHQNNNDVLCSLLVPGGYYRTQREINNIDFIVPPCLEKQNPRYSGVGTYFCVPTTCLNSNTAKLVMQELSSSSTKMYYYAPEEIFSTSPPLYRIETQINYDDGATLDHNSLEAIPYKERTPQA